MWAINPKLFRASFEVLKLKTLHHLLLFIVYISLILLTDLSKHSLSPKFVLVLELWLWKWQDQQQQLVKVAEEAGVWEEDVRME